MKNLPPALRGNSGDFHSEKASGTAAEEKPTLSREQVERQIKLAKQAHLNVKNRREERVS